MRPVRLLAVLGLLLLGAPVGPVAAAVRDVRLTQDGVVPQQLRLAAGDAVRFVNVDTFPHRVVDAGGAWDFDDTLLPGETFTTDALTTAGTYACRGAALDRFACTVVVVGAVEGAAAPAPPPSGSARAGVGDGVEGPAPLVGRTFGGVEGAAPGAGAAPVAVDGAREAATGTAGGAPPAVVAVDGAPAPGGTPRPTLGTPVGARRLGLPVVLAVVLAGGVLSLLVRLLLAEAPARPPGTVSTTS